MDVPDAMQGDSTVPLVDGDGDRSDVFVQPNTRKCGRVLRTDRWKYTVYYHDGEWGEEIERAHPTIRNADYQAGPLSDSRRYADRGPSTDRPDRPGPVCRGAALDTRNFHHDSESEWDT